MADYATGGPALIGTDAESYSLALGIGDADALGAAMARPNKSSALIRVILDAAADLIDTGERAAASDVLAALLDEPELGAAHLRDMAQLALQVPDAVGQYGGANLLVAMCSHPRMCSSTVADALWHVPGRAAAQVATATGTLLPAAVAWVRALTEPDQVRWVLTPTQKTQIQQTELRWAAATTEHPGLAAFLRAHSSDFTDEGTLFAVGLGLTAAPGRIGMS